MTKPSGSNYEFLSDMNTPLNILVVEDHDLLRETMVEMLCEDGHAARGVFCAEEVDGSDALHLPDLYILDLNLPGEDGLSLARRLRATRPGAAVVIVSARGELADRLDGYKTGVDVYLTKPFDPDELLAAVASIAQRLKATHTTDALQLDSRRSLLVRSNIEVPLSLSEVRLLMGFIRARDRMLSFAQTAEHLDLHDAPASRPALNARLSQLQKKLQSVTAEEHTLRSVCKKGYMLCIPIRLV
jgi:DNA-binding response OmpR family regulator